MRNFLLLPCHLLGIKWIFCVSGRNWSKSSDFLLKILPFEKLSTKQGGMVEACRGGRVGLGGQVQFLPRTLAKFSPVGSVQEDDASGIEIPWHETKIDSVFDHSVAAHKRDKSDINIRSWQSSGHKTETSLVLVGGNFSLQVSGSWHLQAAGKISVQPQMFFLLAYARYLFSFSFVNPKALGSNLNLDEPKKKKKKKRIWI